VGLDVIYEFPAASQAIRQGDIFVGLPRVDLSLQHLPIIEDQEKVDTDWENVADKGQPITALVALRSVSAIVITQDCDAIHASQITLCEIRRFADVERTSAETKSPKSWVDKIVQQARKNLKWYYLPPDPQMGFTEKMGVDFQVTLSILRIDLERLRVRRKGRLNSLADEHFRERLSEFFRRYPYDEWYSLNKDELTAYRTVHPDAQPFPWQA
jgi:hypothetical protein